MDGVASIRPGSWLRELARFKPAAWPWGHSIRAALCVGAPFAFGIMTDAIMMGMWVSLGCLMLSAGERAGPYRSTFRQIAISAPIGALGFFVGYLTVLPWAGIVVAMTLLTFICGIASSYAAAISMGTMQALLVASIAIGIPAVTDYWQPAALYLVSAMLYSAVLGVEALLFRERPEQQMISGLFTALAALARGRADGEAVEPRRRTVTERLNSAYAALLDRRYRAVGRNLDYDRMAAVLQGCDGVFALILSTSDAAALRAAADSLSQCAAGNAPPHSPAPDPLARAVMALDDALRKDQSRDIFSGRAPTHASRRNGGIGLGARLDRIWPGREAVLAAAAAALCMGIAYAVHWVDHDTHWFWIPLTVGLIMKPDLGSVFARAVLRSAGTLVGVVIGAAVLTLLPKGLLMVGVMALLAAILPWAMLRSYALQAVALTPLVLILIDLILPGTADIDYAAQRFTDTLIGAGIVLAFGYFPWPRTHARELGRTFHAAKEAIAAYLLAVRAVAMGDEADDLGAPRREAYGHLADLRVRLQKSLAEPPPAGREAAAWFPLIASAERICDAITVYSAADREDVSAVGAQALGRLAALIAAPPDKRALDGTLEADLPDDAPERPLIDRVSAELALMGRLSQPTHP